MDDIKLICGLILNETRALLSIYYPKEEISFDDEPHGKRVMYTPNPRFTFLFRGGNLDSGSYSMVS